MKDDKKETNKSDYYMPIIVFLIENDTIIENGIMRHNEKEKFPAYEFVIKPLLENCLYSYVYGLKDNNKLYIDNKEILIKEKGKHKLDTTKDCITGHEYLWGAVAGKRGSIAIILETNLNIFEKIFCHTFYDSYIQGDNPVDSNPNMGNTISAIKRCKEEMAKGNIGICLSSSNGMGSMTIYVEEKYKDKLIKMYMDSSIKIDYKKKALEILKKAGI